MQLIVINLPESAKRLELLQASLKKLGVSCLVHAAAKGSMLSRADYPGSDSLSPGELGCAVSHCQIYEKLARNPASVACILEDDVRPTKALKRVLEHFDANPPPDGVVVLLNAAFTHFHVVEITKILSPKIKIGIVQGLHGGLGSTGGYILSGHTAKSLVSARQADWSFAADSWISYYRSGALKSAWVVLPYPAPPSFQSESTIGYLPKQDPPVQALKSWPILGGLRNLNRRRVWMSKQIPMRILNHDLQSRTVHAKYSWAIASIKPLCKHLSFFYEKLAISGQAVLVKAGLLEAISCSAGRIFIRRNTSDLTCFKQVFINQEYAIDFPLPISTVVDLGANSGMFSRYIKALFPRANLIAVEPELQNFKALQANLSSLSNVSTINAAIWSQSVDMRAEFKPGGEWGAKTVPASEWHGRSRENGKHLIPGMTFEMLMKAANLSSIDILKIDIEGAELELFKGECSWLKSVGVTIIELHDWIAPGCSKAFCLSIARVLEDFTLAWRGENLIVCNNDYVSSHSSFSLQHVAKNAPNMD